MAKSLSNLKGLALAAVARLAGWKLRQHMFRVMHRSGGAERLVRRRERVASEWLEAYGRAGVRVWLDRPAAGVLWLDADAHAWARQTCTAADLEAADRAVRGEFTLLGASSPASETPAWRRDLYAGTEWPLENAGSLEISRGDGSDIRTVWELSRCYHFIALARAWAATGDQRYVDAFIRHVESFAAQNPVGLGPHWASPMDVAIRAANWTLAVRLFADAPLTPEFWAGMLADLHVAGIWVERHLEWHPVYRGNHYVANLVGLLYLGVLFRGEPAGDRWLRLASRELQQEVRYQVCDDGVAFEGSLAYHRLHTELFAWAGELMRRNSADFDAAAYDAVLRRMVSFMAEYLQPDGLAPMIGDADDGRLHALDTGSLVEPRRHMAGLPANLEAPAPTDGAHTYPYGGFHVLRHGDDHAVIRCGPVGLSGAGSHDHNDQLGFELVVAGRRLVSDSGTYAYTRDLTARHAFRSTAAHSVVQVGGEEQNPIAVTRPWRVLGDRTRARALRCDETPAGLVFAGEHFGYSHRATGVVCRRLLARSSADGVWLLEDEIEGTGEEQLVWRLHLDVAPAAVTITDLRTVLVHDARQRYQLTLKMPEGMRLAVEAGRASESYGVEHTRAVLVVSGTTPLPASIACRIRTLTAEPS
jgi:hypothetical protein